MSKNIEPIWKYPYAKLSDILVPLSVAEKQIRAVEGIDSFHFSVKVKSDNKKYTKDNLYVIPYPYLVSVLDEYNLDADEEIPEYVRNDLHQRMIRYYNFAIDEETLHNIDNNDNICSILNIYNGIIASFDKTKIKDLVPITIPYALPLMVDKLWNIYNGYTEDDYRRMMNGLFNYADTDYDEDDQVEGYINYIKNIAIRECLDGDNYMIVYQLKHNDNEKHDIDDECIWATGTTDSLHSAIDCIKINNNTLSLYKQDSKVILVR